MHIESQVMWNTLPGYLFNIRFILFLGSSIYKHYAIGVFKKHLTLLRLEPSTVKELFNNYEHLVTSNSFQ